MTDNYLVIAAGGTGGHMFPAQALAQEMLRRGWRVALSSDDRGLRYAAGFPEAVTRREVKAATFARGGLLSKAVAPFQIAGGVASTISWFRGDRPAAVIGFGGYPSLPALSAAQAMAIPRLIHEQNGVLGRVNAVFARRVHALALGVAPVRNAPAKARTVVVGNPIRDAARAQLNAPYPSVAEGGPIRLLVFGGSQGATVFAENVPPALALSPGEFRARLRVTQQAREADLPAVKAAYAQAAIEAEVAPFFQDMPERIAAAPLVICRAGASTIAELTAIGRPSILAPYPQAAADHQTANAGSLAAAGAALVLPDHEMTPSALALALGELFGAPDRLAEMAAAAKTLGKPDAAERLADLVEEIAARR